MGLKENSPRSAKFARFVSYDLVHGLDERQYNFRELIMLFRATRQVGNLGAFLFRRARIHDS